jgi:hypothetical protein
MHKYYAYTVSCVLLFTTQLTKNTAHLSPEMWDSHSGVFEDSDLLVYEAVSFWKWFLTFKRSVLLPHLRVKDYLTLELGGSTFLRNTEEPFSQRHSFTSPKTWIFRLKMNFCIFSCFFGFILYLTENTVSIKKTNILCKKVFKWNVRHFHPILTKWKIDIRQSHHIRISQQPEGQVDMKKLTIAFRKCIAKAPKI